MLTDKESAEILKLKNTLSIYSAWSNTRLFKRIIDELSSPFEKLQVDKVVGIEARGFIVGAPVAYKLNAGFVVVRKEGNMYARYSPDDVLQEKCTDYSSKEKILEIEKSDTTISRGDKVVIIDDWFEKGAQGKAVIRLIERKGGIVVGIGVLLDEMTYEVLKSFSKYNIHTLVKSKHSDKGNEGMHA